MSRRGSCSSGSTTATTAAETKPLLLFVGQTRRLTFIFYPHPQIGTLLQTAL